MEPLDLGASVRQVVRPVEGQVVDVRYSAKEKDFECLVGWTDGADKHQRWFKQSDLEEVKK
jgi:hypothetical protein